MNSLGAPLPTKSQTCSNAVDTQEKRMSILCGDLGQYCSQFSDRVIDLPDADGTKRIKPPYQPGTNNRHDKTKDINENVIAMVNLSPSQ
jgi:hypothetical protein